MLISDLFEKRRNPDKNPKIGALQALEKYRGMDVFVSFTDDLGKSSHEDLENKADVYLAARNASGAKIGINPKYSFGTPLGVYTYPVDYVIEQNLGVEFGRDRPFLWVVRPRAGVKILRMKSYREDDFNRDAEAMREIAHIYGMFDDEATFDAKFDAFVQYAKATAKPSFPGGDFWNMTRLVATFAGKGKTKSQVARIWSRILRELGYGVIVDDAGFGIIHSNEPTQAVFLGPDCYDAVELIRNTKPAQPKSLSEIWDDNTDLFIMGLLANKLPFEQAIRHLTASPGILRDYDLSELPLMYQKYIRENPAVFVKYGGVRASDLDLSEATKIELLRDHSGVAMYFGPTDWTPGMLNYVAANPDQFVADFDRIPMSDSDKADIYTANPALANLVRLYTNSFSDVTLRALLAYYETLDDGEDRDMVLRKIKSGLWGKRNRDPQIYLDFLRRFKPQQSMFGWELMSIQNWAALLLCFPEFDRKAQEYVLNSINATHGVPDGYVDRMAAMM